MTAKFERIRKDVEKLSRDERSNQVIAAIYARVSSPKQMNNYSLDEQVRICRDFLKVFLKNARGPFTELMVVKSG